MIVSYVSGRKFIKCTIFFIYFTHYLDSGTCISTMWHICRRPGTLAVFFLHYL